MINTKYAGTSRIPSTTTPAMSRTGLKIARFAGMAMMIRDELVGQGAADLGCLTRAPSASDPQRGNRNRKAPRSRLRGALIAGGRRGSTAARRESLERLPQPQLLENLRVQICSTDVRSRDPQVSRRLPDQQSSSSFAPLLTGNIAASYLNLVSYFSIQRLRPLRLHNITMRVYPDFVRLAAKFGRSRVRGHAKVAVDQGPQTIPCDQGTS